MMTRLGIYSLLAGLFLGLFSGISSFMESKNFWIDLTISRTIGDNKSEAIIGFFDVDWIQNSLDVLIYELPLFSLLLGLGVIFLVISLFLKDH